MNSISKRQLRSERITLDNLINRYGGEINLLAAHDNVCVALDYRRGSGLRRKRKKQSFIDNFTEDKSWMG